MDVLELNTKMREALHAAGIKADGIMFDLCDTGCQAVGPLAGKVLPGTPDGLTDDAGHGRSVGSILIQWAPGAVITSYRVLPTANSPTEPVVRQLEALEQTVKADTKYKHIVNLSLASGLNKTDPLAARYTAACDALTAAGAIVVAAAGNDGTTNPGLYPGCVPSAYCAAACDEAGKHAGFSTLHNEVDFADAGVNVPTLTPITGRYNTVEQGTSFACPTLAGKIALLMSAYKTWRGSWPEDAWVYDTLKRLALDIGSSTGRDPDTGWGWVDLKTPDELKTLIGAQVTPTEPKEDTNMDTILSKVIDTGLSWPTARVRRAVTDHIQIHHTVGKYGTPARWTGLQAHEQDEGNKGVPYSYLVLQDGSVYLGRGHEYAHGGVKDSLTNKANQRSVAIALDGDMRADNLPTDKQLAAALELTREIMAIYSIPAGKVLGHNEIPLYADGKPAGKLYPTLCPCIDMTAFRAALGTTPDAPKDKTHVYAGSTYSNVRKGPGTSYDKVGQISAGETCTLLGAQDGWAHIRKADGVEGWCIATYLKKV